MLHADVLLHVVLAATFAVIAHMVLKPSENPPKSGDNSPKDPPSDEKGEDS